VNNTTGAGNIALGNFAGSNLTTGDNNIDIGNTGVAGEANTIRIGTIGTQTATYIAGIYTTPVAQGLVVKVDSTGHLGTVGSSERFKTEIKPMDKASEAILALKPVTFHYKKEFDPEGIPQFGLVAEDVAKVNPDLVVRDGDGKVYTVRYEAVNAMLLNEFLKQHRTVQQLESTVTKQEATITQQEKDSQSTAARQQREIKAVTASLKEQAVQIQKVSAKLEVSKPDPQTVSNP
jgi:predicted ribosome quality control (RQC) complex YloA/Tae2 family protein